MERTWRSEHHPKLAIPNLETGDVAVCGAFGAGDPDLAHLDVERVAVVAPLDSRSDLEWLLRGLLLHPNVGQLVLCGSDPRATGESLLALWKDGLDAEGRIAGSRGRLSEAFDAGCVDVLRRSVILSDWRERPLAEVADRIGDLPVLPGEREPRAVPDSEIPTRKVFLSRKTTFPIFSNSIGDAWLQLLNLVLRIGTEKRSGDGERTAEALNAVVTIEPPEGEVAFPDFLDFNRDDFERYNHRFARPETADGTRHELGARLRDWQGLDQIDALCERLRDAPDTCSGSAVLAAPEELAAAAAPDLLSATFNVVDGKLFGSFVHRRTDLYGCWPLEAMALLDLQNALAERLGIAMGSATFVTHAAQLRARDWERSNRVLSDHFKRPLPLQVDPSGIFLFGNDGGKARAMLLDHDASTIFWEEAFSDPEDLSWYIVDVMPWLLPQHIRYVGQECASLMRAIQAGECYLQG